MGSAMQLISAAASDGSAVASDAIASDRLNVTAPPPPPPPLLWWALGRWWLRRGDGRDGLGGCLLRPDAVLCCCGGDGCVCVVGYRASGGCGVVPAVWTAAPASCSQ